MELALATAAIRKAYGDAACRAALDLSWQARRGGDLHRSDFMLSVAIRLCRPGS